MTGTSLGTAAIIGGGVVGGGWAARFLLMGWDVKVFDPDPMAPRKVNEVLENARRSLPGLYDQPLPPEGQLTYCNTIAQAVTDARWIQESVPERIDLKNETLSQIQSACDPDAVIGSSTSGFKPSELQHGARRPDQILVAHPINPVYLLPLVELVQSPKNDAQVYEIASGIIESIGMFPLRVRAGVDAHIADRLLEAVWREALWLVNDGVATTAEIDEAIRMGFGLRWAQMGLFETYRIAGGEAGIAHLLAQFGPALKWPRTKLMDVPELTDDLIKTILNQSDAQSGGRSIRGLEQARDINLVGILRALKATDSGAGTVLNSVDQSLRQDPGDPAGQLNTVARAIPLDWTDHNGHMNEARYLQAFSDATDRFMEIIGCDSAYIAAGSSYFTAETHIRHIDEAIAGTRIHVTTQCLYGEGKKLHLFNVMYDGGRLLATGEHFLLHVSLATRKPSEPSAVVAGALERIARSHALLPRPDGVGRTVGQRPDT